MKRVGIADFRRRYGPWALVAGASEGLGAEFATQLAINGLNLVLVARRKEPLEALAATLAQEHAIEVRTIEMDLSRDDIESVITEQTGEIDIGLLVYNAATSFVGPFFGRTLQDRLNEVDVNCRAPLTLTYLFGQRLLKRGRGGIILMSSLSSAQGSALVANYAATKAYNRILAEGLWEELRAQGVDVLACSAGPISTPGYLASLPAASKRSVGMALSTATVAAETLAKL
ncbi:MAG: SDR family NAD(P)-dependent oxidoreductase, partial [Ktedonobacteraceae bacterium]|nr:SDR family NAD(P)-dependent oxidoreductase [Ktedonobacteraceae bacterium]